MEGKGFCHGAATIVNGIATGMGASFGIGLRTEARVRLVDEPGRFDVRIGNDPGEDPGLAVHCVRGVLERFGLAGTYGAVVDTASDIPISRGLKSSSTASNAIILATLDALDEDCSAIDVVSMGIEASFKAGVTITGAFDDACASYYGGAVVTDNKKRTILARYPMDEGLSVLVHVPDEKIRKSSIDTHRIEGMAPAMAVAHDLAMKGDYRAGLLINGLAYGVAMGLDIGIAMKAMNDGALTAGITGTGPATVVLCEPENADRIASSIDAGHLIRTFINNTEAGRGL